MKQVGICGVGAAVPSRILTNFDLEKMVETSDEWIVTRTGIHERRILEADESILKYIVESARIACDQHHFPAAEVDFVINSTLSPDRISPAQAFEVAKELEAHHAFCFDMNAACSGLMYGLATAESFLKTRDVKYGLVTAGEQLSRFIDYTDRSSCILFGDAAAAVLVTNDHPEHLILASDLGSNPAMADEVVIGGVKELIQDRRSDFYFRQNGKSVFRFAVSKIKELYETIPAKAGVCPSDIRYLIPHQANIRIIEAAAKDITGSNTEVIANLDQYGNTSSASIGLALHETWRRFKKGDLILMVGFGAGLSWGGVLLEW